MGQNCAKSQENFDPNQVTTKDKNDNNMNNKYQFVKQKSANELNSLDETQFVRSGQATDHKINRGENEENEQQQQYYSKNYTSNQKNQIEEMSNTLSKVNKNLYTSELSIADWMSIIIQDMCGAGFEGTEYEIHHTDCSIKLVLLFTAMNYKKIDQFVDLGHTQWLEYVMLDIQFHHFDKVGIARISDKLQGLIHLQYLILDFSNNKIAMNSQCISNCVSNLPELKMFTLNLEGNNIGEEGCRLVGKSLLNLKFLNQLSLNLKWNKIQDNGLIYISDSVSKMRFINQFSIDASGNQITQYGATIFFQSIQEIGKLSSLLLNISNNNVDVQGAYSLAKYIQQQDNLMELTLYLNGNNITSSGGYSIIESLLKLFNLVKLDIDISFNGISVYDGKQIREKFFTLSSISKKEIRIF